MPVMTGLEALRALRRERKTAKTPIIMVTARGSLEDIEACIKLGASDYVNKPFEMDKLMAKVDKLVPPPPKTTAA